MTNESKRDWENLLKPEDFWVESTQGKRNPEPIGPEQAAESANEIIRKELEKLPSIFYGSDTTVAKLFPIKEIKRD